MPDPQKTARSMNYGRQSPPGLLQQKPDHRLKPRSSPFGLSLDQQVPLSGNANLRDHPATEEVSPYRQHIDPALCAFGTDRPSKSLPWHVELPPENGAKPLLRGSR